MVRTDVANHRISGKYDFLEDLGADLHRLWDLKTTSVWSVVYKDKLEDYCIQLSIYRYLCHRNGIIVDDTAKILFIFTDWKRSDSRKPDYPDTRLMEMDIHLWDLDRTESWIRDRLDLLDQAAETPDHLLPDCTPEELWQTADKWAHMRTGRKSAVKLYNSQDEADTAILDDTKGYVEHRPGKVKRCPEYCAAWPVCHQYRRLREQGLVDTQEE